jgi:hypothetical protein
MFICECGTPADFWITASEDLQGAPAPQITRTAVCLSHVTEALVASGAYGGAGKVMRLAVSVHRNSNHD